MTPATNTDSKAAKHGFHSQRIHPGPQKPTIQAYRVCSPKPLKGFMCSKHGVWAGWAIAPGSLRWWTRKTMLRRCAAGSRVGAVAPPGPAGPAGLPPKPPSRQGTLGGVVKRSGKGKYAGFNKLRYDVTHAACVCGPPSWPPPSEPRRVLGLESVEDQRPAPRRGVSHRLFKCRP